MKAQGDMYELVCSLYPRRKSHSIFLIVVDGMMAGAAVALAPTPSCGVFHTSNAVILSSAVCRYGRYRYLAYRAGFLLIRSRSFGFFEPSIGFFEPSIAHVIYVH